MCTLTAPIIIYPVENASMEATVSKRIKPQKSTQK
jgi:hypothetical protein